MIRICATLSCLLALAFVFGCATPGPGYKEYPHLDETMADEIEPVVEEILPKELNKDASEVDYDRIQAAAAKAAYYFRCAQDPSHSMFVEKPKVVGYAKAAETWFVAIADAAMHRKQVELVKLYGQKAKVCTSCHD